MKKIITIALAMAMLLGLATGCAPANDDSEGVLKVAAIETAYGSEMWQKVCGAFTEQTGIQVELTTDKNLEDVISGPMQNGDYPDVVHLATGRPAGLTEQLIKQNGLHSLENVLNMTVPGESKKVSEKIAGGFTDTSLTNPYADGKTYLAPMFYSPCGLFYNQKLFAEKGWTVPTTWDEMWALGDKAKAEGIALFTYPTAGYYDAFMFALMYSIGGAEFFDKATHYEAGIWDSAEAKTLFSILDKLADYTHEKTPAQANNQDFTKNQLMVMQNEALFMPNGTWITGEMANAEATLTNDFAWGMTALPAVKAGGDGYSFCWFEQAWMPVQKIRKRRSSSWRSCTLTRPVTSLPIPRSRQRMAAPRRAMPSSLCWGLPTSWKGRISYSSPSTTMVPRRLWAASRPLRRSPALMSALSSSSPSTRWWRAH